MTDRRNELTTTRLRHVVRGFMILAAIATMASTSLGQTGALPVASAPPAASSSPTAAPAPTSRPPLACDDGLHPAHAARVECYAGLGHVPFHVWLRWTVDALLAVGVTVILGLLGKFTMSLHLRRGANQQADSSFDAQNIYLVHAFQAILSIPLMLVAGAHMYGISSLLTGQSYLVDFSRSSLVSIGMLALGFLLGALFGLPQTRGEDPASAESVPPQQAVIYARFGNRLESVADWLTKLLIGAGLTQIHWIWDNGHAINNFFARATGMELHRPLGTVLAFGSVAAGFLLGYIAALLFLPVALQAGMLGLGRLLSEGNSTGGDTAEKQPGQSQ